MYYLSKVTYTTFHWVESSAKLQSQLQTTSFFVKLYCTIHIVAVLEYVYIYMNRYVMAWIVNWWYLVTKTNPQLPWNLLHMEGWYFLFVMQMMVLVVEKPMPLSCMQVGIFLHSVAKWKPHPYHMHCLFIQTRLQQANDSQKEPTGHENLIACLYPYTR